MMLQNNTLLNLIAEETRMAIVEQRKKSGSDNGITISLPLFTEKHFNDIGFYAPMKICGKPMRFDSIDDNIRINVFNNPVTFIPLSFV